MQPHHPDLALFLRWTYCQVSGLLHGERPTSTTLLSFWAGTPGLRGVVRSKTKQLSASKSKCHWVSQMYCSSSLCLLMTRTSNGSSCWKGNQNPGSTENNFEQVPCKVGAFVLERSLVGDQVGAVESDAELTNHANVTSRSHRFHECLRSWLCNGAQVVDQFVLGHANARILDGQGGVRLVGNDLDEKVGLGLQSATFLYHFVGSKRSKSSPMFQQPHDPDHQNKNVWKRLLQHIRENSSNNHGHWIKMNWIKRI